MNKKTYLLIDNEQIEITNALIGARMVNRGETPFSVYSGNVDIAEVGVALLNTFRGVIKINQEEHGLTLEDSKDFILFTLREAFRLENERRNDFTKGYSMDSLVKKYLDTQF